MIDRIKINEERLDKILSNIKELDAILDKFNDSKNDLVLLNKYYGSKNWFKDKESFETNKISNVKAGVLSEDAVWNMNDDITDLLKKMKSVLKKYKI